MMFRSNHEEGRVMREAKQAAGDDVAAHLPEDDGLVRWCVVCDVVWPCPTRREQR